MNSDIKIKFLSANEMRNAKDIDWRYEHVGDDNLGFVDKEKNKIFIRAGMEQEFMRDTIDHELNHIFEKKATHEDEHGIRHSWFSDIFRGVVDTITKPFQSGKTSLSPEETAAKRQAESGNTSWFKQLMPLITFAATNLIGSGMSSLFGGAGSGAGAVANAYGSGVNAGAFPASIQGLGSGIAGSLSDGVFTGSLAPAGAIGAAQSPSFGSGFSDWLGHMFSGGFNPVASSTPTGNFQFPSESTKTPPPFTGEFGASLPPMSATYGNTGMQTSTGIGDTTGLSMMPTNPGLGQAGLDLQGKDPSIGFGQQGQQGQQNGFDQMFGGLDPIGFNYSNGGQLSF